MSRAACMPRIRPELQTFGDGSVPARGRSVASPSFTVRARTGETEKNHDCAVQSQDVLIVESPDALADLALGDRGDLIDHQTTLFLEPIASTGLYRQPEQRRWRTVGREWTTGYGKQLLEPIILQYRHRSRLAGIIRAA